MNREELLQRVRTSLGQAAPATVPHPAPPQPPLAGAALIARFVSRLEELEVTIVRCAGRSAAHESLSRLAAERGWRSVCGPASLHLPTLAGLWTDDPRGADIGLAEADWAIAATGSVVILNGGPAARSHSLLPPVSGIFVAESRVLPYLGNVLRHLTEFPGLPACVSIISGPSNTADINATRCVGVHGPGEVIIWLIAGE